MKLSILILTIPSRIDGVFSALFHKVCKQALGMPVEVLALADNKKLSIGRKRDILVHAASGERLAFIDDDDDVSDDYIAEILRAAERGDPDVIVFNQRAILNSGTPFSVKFGIEYENEPANGKDIKRKPWHMCVWRSSMAKRHPVPHVNYGEDWKWCESMLPDVRTQTRIDKVLHYYQYDRARSEAPISGAREKRDQSCALSVLIPGRYAEYAKFVASLTSACANANASTEVLGMIGNGDADYLLTLQAAALGAEKTQLGSNSNV